MAGENEMLIEILTFQYSVVVKGIERQLKSLGYQVAIEEREINEDAGILLLYLPDDLLDSIKKVSSVREMCDKVFASQKKMIIICEKRYQENFISAIPLLNLYAWIERPINMSLLLDELNRQLGATRDAGPAGGSDSAASTPYQPKPAVTDTGVKHVLIVDDDPSYAKMVREWMKGKYKVSIVTNGLQAIKFLVKNPVDLILLDYEMPVVDGPQTLEMLRTEEETSQIPVVFLTGVGTKESIMKVMALKPEGYILKSTTRDELLRHLRKIFEKLENQMVFK